MDNHVTSFPRHAALLKEKDIPDSRAMLLTNETPYTITYKDSMPLTDQESTTYWRSRKTLRFSSPLPIFVVDDLLPQAASEVFTTKVQSPSLSCQMFHVPVPVSLQLVLSSVPVPMSLPPVATTLLVPASSSPSPSVLHPPVVPVSTPVSTTTVDISN